MGVGQLSGASLRVKKVAGGTTTRYIFSGTKVIAEYANGSLSKEYIYSGSQLLATLNSGTPTYHHAGHLSARVNTNSSGTTVGQQAHYPFGESWYATSTTTKWQFTTYERDAESTLDYAIFRYDNSRLGRFMTPDPITGSIFNPQSLNRYAYVVNDPINLIDPLGLEADEFTISVTVTAFASVKELVCSINPGSPQCGYYPGSPGGGGVGGDALAAQTVQRIEQKDLPIGVPGKRSVPTIGDCVITGGVEDHPLGKPAIDISVGGRIGVPVRAPVSGVVNFTRSNASPWPFPSGDPVSRPANNVSIVEDGSKFIVQVIHVRPVPGLVPGKSRVKAGQVIGFTDQSGWQSAPHIHLQAFTPGRRRQINPTGFVPGCKKR